MRTLRINSRKKLLTQVGVAALLGALAFYLFQTLQSNLERQGIQSGFDFLNAPAGFQIAMSIIPYDEGSSYGRAFVVAILNSFLVSGLGIVCATPLGFLIGFARKSHHFLIRSMSRVYIEIMRNVPLLLQIFFWYFAVLQSLPSPRQSLILGGVVLNIRGLFVPSFQFQEYGLIILALSVTSLLLVIMLCRRESSNRKKILMSLLLIPSVIAHQVLGPVIQLEFPVLKGFNFEGGIQLIPELVALWISLSIYTSAYIAEIVRAGLESVPLGQLEATKTLGLNRLQAMRFVIIPQALRVIIPPLTSQYLNLIKNSSLASAIGYPDLVLIFAGTSLNQTGQAIEVILMTMTFYLCVSLIVSYLMNIYNKRVALLGGVYD